MLKTAELWEEWAEEDPLGFVDVICSEAGAPLGGASAVDGVPLLADVLTDARLVVLIRFGSVWTDVTTDVQYSSPLTITIGRGSESGVAPPAKAALTLANPDRRYSQHDPLSPNWPNVVENARLWVRLFVAGQYFTRFYGEIKGFKQDHDTTGRISLVRVTAAGITQRLGLRTTPFKSPLYRAILASNPRAYWAMEDGPNSTQAASATTQATPLIPVHPATPPAWAQSTGPPGSDKLPTFKPPGGMELDAAVTPGSLSPASARYEFVFKFGAADVLTFIADWSMTGVNPTSNSIVHMKADMLGPGDPGEQGQLRFGWFTGNFSNTGIGGNLLTGHYVNDSLWHHLRIDLTASGGDTQVVMKLDNAVVLSTTLTGGLLGTLTQMRVALANDQFETEHSIGHAASWEPYSAPSVDTYQAFLGYAGESPRDRIARVCAEEGIPFDTVGFYVSNVTMGPQGTDPLMTILRECELADAAFLYDGLSEGLQLQGISQRYDQFSRVTIDGTAGKLLPPFEPLPDDFGRVNRMTVRRKNGSSATVEDTDGPLGTDAIGVYDASLPQPVNYQSDAALSDRAGWEVHKGSGRPGFRYPSVTFDLRNSPDLVYSNSVTGWLSITPGLMLTATQPFTAQNPGEDIRLLVEGWTETITPKTLWRVIANCGRQDVYDVFKIEDASLGRLQASASSLVAPAGAGAGALSVATAAGPLWTTTAAFPADFPLYVEISGIQVKVTAIAGAASPQTFTVDASTVTKHLAAGDRVALWRPGVIAL